MSNKLPKNSVLSPDCGVHFDSADHFFDSLRYAMGMKTATAAPKFKVGDRVTHRYFPDGFIESIDTVTARARVRTDQYQTWWVDIQDLIVYSPPGAANNVSYTPTPQPPVIPTHSTTQIDPKFVDYECSTNPGWKYRAYFPTSQGFLTVNCQECKNNLTIFSIAHQTQTLTPAQTTCANCDDAQWVCENHNQSPWNKFSKRIDACGCGAGVPCPSCNRLAMTPRNSSASLPVEELGRFRIRNPNVSETKRCECGSEAVGSPRHSSWCAKYE